MLVGSTGSAVRLVGGVAPATYGGKNYYIYFSICATMYIPTAIRYPLAEDFLLDTLHSYHPTSLPVTVSVWW